MPSFCPVNRKTRQLSDPSPILRAMINRSWENVLRTPKEIAVALDLATPQPIEDAIAGGELAALLIGESNYVSQADFMIWVASRGETGFLVTMPDGSTWLLSDLRGVPGDSRTEALKASWRKDVRRDSAELD
jgi:hypothetical protein